MVHAQRLGFHIPVQRAIAPKTTAAKPYLVKIINAISSFLRVPLQVQLSLHVHLHLLLHPPLLLQQLQRLPPLLVAAVCGTSMADGVPMMTHKALLAMIPSKIAALSQAILNKAHVPIATFVMEEIAKLCLPQKHQLHRQLPSQLQNQLQSQLLHQLHHRLKHREYDFFSVFAVSLMENLSNRLVPIFTELKAPLNIQ